MVMQLALDGSTRYNTDTVYLETIATVNTLLADRSSFLHIFFPAAVQFIDEVSTRHGMEELTLDKFSAWFDKNQHSMHIQVVLADLADRVIEDGSAVPVMRSTVNHSIEVFLEKVPCASVEDSTLARRFFLLVCFLRESAIC